MRSRREFTRRIKAEAFARAKGRCEKCTAKLMPGNIHYDHVLPDGLGGAPTLTNCAVLCRACHGEKTTKRDVPQIAKADRTRAKHIGAKRSARPLPGGKYSKWKQKVGGRWVLREPEMETSE